MNFNMKLVAKAAEAVTKIVNTSTDSRFEAFTKSTFKWRYHTVDGQVLTASKLIALQDKKGGKGNWHISTKLHCSIHPDEMQILLRRLNELEEADSRLSKDAGLLIDNIIYTKYDIELE